ncbi:uncharacterized protein LOC100373741 [Saccoglossus kowalevskii]|uniref:Uncharacterized protein LOC100373741 n=1 Tax=Saccoglossus kowalevskii TaxID=10224 RepID=A0ABM0GYA0_SACKO|nr:PREDICTED: uncharacterized protein LOC100373741 [Saccoglossus kowalevskii]
MDTADDVGPDVPSLQSTMQITRPERYDIDDKVQSPISSRSNLSQMFDFSSILRAHPRKYELILEEEERDLQQSKPSTNVRRKTPRSRSVDSRIRSTNKDKGVEKQRDEFLKKKSLSHADVSPSPSHTEVMPYGISQKSSADDTNEKTSRFLDLKNELISTSDETAHMYEPPVTDSEDEVTVVPATQSRFLSRQHSFPLLDEEMEFATVTLPDGSKVQLPDVDVIASGQQTPVSENPSPVCTPKHSPRLRARHDLQEENMKCVPVLIQSNVKKLFGIGPEFQHPPEHTCVREDDARQLGLMQRVVQGGFTANKKSFFHQREDMDFFPPDNPPKTSAVDGAQKVKNRFISKPEMNFLSPTSM